ncbi:molybdopterin molybdotransferase [Psychromicrobium silvestre]|uniref:Molybdopterin molybdenumtransferase n=1 Tax=Psychromicrobium silvestre TaxID=1645614 RepID=A0A7Y9S8B2_9MICC|nr:gephyrin-like molybdotransferase Glp [Psychromicrobium silvestre]NYE96723.1 molybdopterin molybdotransferase [Psychromicrobium silvestre]
MRTVSEHQRDVAELLAPLFAQLDSEAETVPLREALHRVLFADLLAPIDLPPFDNSQMDGYVLRAAESGASLFVAATIPAGSNPAELASGQAAPIMTGAKIPAGADAVVPVELAEPARFLEPGAQVRLPSVPTDHFIRRAGSDLAAGQLALRAGTRLGPAQLGLAAALGLAELQVRRRPRVTLLSTGDEVLPPGQPLRPGAIYDANSTLLGTALVEAGAQLRVLPSLPDDPAELAATLNRLEDVDLLISTGGISQGAYEVVKQALAGKVEFHSVAMQPGGPQAIGAVPTASGVRLPFLGFPGNPVSTLVSFEMFLRPLLAGPRTVVRARITSAVSSPEAKHQVRRGFFQAGTVELLGGPGSHLLHALSTANALVQLPVGLTALEAEEEVEVWLL